MNAWSLAIEAGHPNPHSYVSDDGGRTWRNRKMAYLNILSGEYVVRMRLGEGEDPPPPAMVWEDPENPRLKHLRTIAPPAAVRPRGAYGPRAGAGILAQHELGVHEFRSGRPVRAVGRGDHPRAGEKPSQGKMAEDLS